MASSALYFTTPGVAQAALATANTNIDGTTGTYVSVVAGTAAGRRIAKLRVINALTGAQVANKINFFESLDGGTTKRFVCDCLMPAGSAMSATIRGSYIEVPELVGKTLFTANNVLYASTHIAQATNVVVEYNDA